MTQVRPELRVEIRKLGNRYQAVIRTGNDSEVATHEFQYDTGSLVHGSTDRLSDATGLPQSAESIPDPVQIAAQGWQLYRSLFDNDRRLCEYLASHQEVRQSQLTLSLSSEARNLSRLPWEYLYDGDTYLCLTGNMPVSHRPHGLKPLTLQATPLPLRILLLVAAPDDSTSFDAEHELAVLQRALAEEVSRGIIHLDVPAEQTSAMLLEATQRHLYHIIHYIGYGVQQPPQRQSFLCLEDSVGRSELLSGGQLSSLLEKSLPNLVVLSGSPGVQFGVADAFAGVAHDLLHHDIPATLSIPASLSGSSAQAFYKAFYGSLADSQTVAESLYQGRAALKLVEVQVPAAEHFAWAIPVLYQRQPHLQLIQGDTAAEVCEEKKPSPSVLKPPRLSISLVGRKADLHAVRRALQDSARIFYVWGSTGVGKHSFVSHLLDHLVSPSRSLVVRCSATAEPLRVLAQISDFWRSGESDTEEEAARLLLDARQDPLKRAQKAQALLANKRYLFCFENIDRWFAPDDEGRDTISNNVVRDILLGLMTVPSRSLFFFTGARRWDELANIEDADIREIYLPLLSEVAAIQVMNGLPELRSATLTQKQAIYWFIGGHPKSLALLAGCLDMGVELHSLLAAPPVEERSTDLWQAFLIDEILRRLDPGEYQILQSLALLSYPITAANLSELTPVTVEHAQPLIEHWHRLGLIETLVLGVDHSDTQFDVYLPVRDEVLGRMDPSEMVELHLQAAEHCGGPFIDAARRQVLARNITAWTDDRIEWLARDTNGILGTWLRQQSDSAQTQVVLTRAMAWQQHLWRAGKIEEATQIVHAIVPTLKRQAQIDLAEALMRRSVMLSSQPGYTTGIDQLAQLHLEEGPLSAALDVYRQVYESLDPQTADLQRAHVMMRAGIVQHRLGHIHDAIASFQLALQSIRREGDKESEAECLYRLAILQRETGDLRQALVYAQAAREHCETFDSPLGLAAVEREQGLILKELGHLNSALECFSASLRVSRRLGDRAGVTQSLTEIGLILEKSGRNEMAIRVIEEALQHYEYLKNPEHSEILSLLANLRTRKQRMDEAIARIRTARNLSS